MKKKMFTLYKDNSYILRYYVKDIPVCGQSVVKIDDREFKISILIYSTIRTTQNYVYRLCIECTECSKIDLINVIFIIYSREKLGFLNDVFQNKDHIPNGIFY